MVWKNPKSAGLLDLRKRDAIHHVISHSRKKRAERRSCHWKRPLVITLISTFTWWIHTDSNLDLSEGLYIFLNFENVYNDFVLRCTTTTKVLMQINVNPIFLFRLCLLPFSFYAIISLIIENKSMDIVRLCRWAWIMLVGKSLFFHSIERAASYLHRRSLNSAGSKSGADKFFGPKIPIWSEILQY